MKKSHKKKASSKRTPRDGILKRDALFAPWRLEFIKGPKEPNCFFCEASKLKSNNPSGWRNMLLVHRTRNAQVLLNRYPYISGHLLIAPRRHSHDLPGLTNKESTELWQLSRDCVKILNDVMAPQGINVGMNLGKAAGAGIEDHLHMHVMPRWVGDTNFLPTIGHTQTVPSSLELLWDELYPVFKKLT